MFVTYVKLKLQVSGANAAAGLKIGQWRRWHLKPDNCITL